MVYSAWRFVFSLALCYFLLVFFSPFNIAITLLGEKRANLSAFRTFVRFALVWFCLFPLPLRVWDGLRLVIVDTSGLFSYLFWTLFAGSGWVTYQVAPLVNTNPTGTTRSLISNFLYSWTIRPLFSGIKGCRKVSNLNIFSRKWIWVIQPCSTHCFHIAKPVIWFHMNKILSSLKINDVSDGSCANP